MIILASTSPTRQTILTNAGLSFTAAAPGVDEGDLVARNPSWSPQEVALKLAEAKAADVSRRYPDALVIGADQVLALGNRIYAKPATPQQCRQHLLELRGRTHMLISSVVCARSGETQWFQTAEASLVMRQFSDEFLEQYLGKVGMDCMSSVGGYKIEGLGLQLFEKVEGDHFTILGLPLLPLLSYLRSTGKIMS
ncbi:Maf family nucleotide pyrophosphatase [Aestuariivirga sp.]|jgi:septum formation protein|uniref:Maf family nucleotide pyrophosphatase n=1 Tax=Aestuariivirga sp. TaxID=2650926 RepID=UPI0037852017